MEMRVKFVRKDGIFGDLYRVIDLIDGIQDILTKSNGMFYAAYEDGSVLRVPHTIKIFEV